MKIILFLLNILFISLSTYSQQNNVWTFGSFASMNFDYPTSISISSGNIPNINTNEGTASISDANGNLLFYSNGVNIWNQNNNLIAEAAGLTPGPLSGGASSTSSAIIVPEPGLLPNTQTNRYYVFTVPSAELIQQQPSIRIKFSIVSFATNPLGEIVVKNSDLPLLPGQTYTTKTEKIIAARTCDGLGFWIVTHDHNSTTFRSHLLTNSGINASNTVVSTTLGTNKTYRGYMRISPDNQKIGFADYDKGIFLFDFNNSTGEISTTTSQELSSLPIYPNIGDTQQGSRVTYGVEFSPNSQILYFTCWKRGIYALDLATLNITQIFEINSSNISQTVGALALAPDGKIYVARWTTPSALGQWWSPTPGTFLSRISNPNTINPANYEFNAISFPVGSGSLYGLPTFMPTYQSPELQLSAINSLICEGDSTTLTASGSNTYNWSPPLGLNQTSGASVIASPSASTTYTVSSMNNFGCSSSSQITIIVDTTCCNQSTYFISENLNLCQGTMITFPDGTTQTAFNNTVNVSNLFTAEGCDSLITTNVTIIPSTQTSQNVSICSGTNYTYPDGMISSNILVDESHNSIFQNAAGCDSIIATQITVVNSPEINLIPDISKCAEEFATLNTNASNVSDYLWSTGEISSSIQVREEGTYSVQVSNNCGSVLDSVKVINLNCTCTFYLPNTFTPDEDEYNQTFGAEYDCKLSDFEMQIYNRWGEMIFQNFNIDYKWNGTYDGKIVPQGTYTYKIKYTTNLGEDLQFVGHVNVLR